MQGCLLIDFNIVVFSLNIALICLNALVISLAFWTSCDAKFVENGSDLVCVYLQHSAVKNLFSSWAWVTHAIFHIHTQHMHAQYPAIQHTHAYTPRQWDMRYLSRQSSWDVNLLSKQVQTPLCTERHHTLSLLNISLHMALIGCLHLRRSRTTLHSHSYTNVMLSYAAAGITW